MPFWDKNGQDPILPGLYQAIEQMQESVIRPGERGVIAMVTPGLTAFKGKVTELTGVGGAVEALGVSNYKFAKRCFAGGARKIIAYVPNDNEALSDSLKHLDPYYFDVFTMGRDVVADDMADIKSWRIANIETGINYVAVVGGAAGLADNTAIKSLYATGKHGDIMHVGMGGVDIEGNVVSPGELAAWIAGAQGAKGMGQGSLTRQSINFLADVERRLTKAQREDLYTAGIAVPIHNGSQVVLEAAITSSKVIEGTNPSKPHYAGGKLRIAYNASVYQTALNQAVEDQFIGKINNDREGQDILIGALNDFNDALIREEVLAPGTATALHPDFPSVGDRIYLLTQGFFIDAAEQFFIDFQLGSVPATAATGGA